MQRNYQEALKPGRIGNCSKPADSLWSRIIKSQPIFFEPDRYLNMIFFNPEKATVKKMFWVKVAKYEIIFCHINKVLKYQRKIISNKSLYIKNVTTFFLFYDLPHVINHHKFCNVTISQFLSRHKTPFGSDQHKDYIASQKGRLSIFTVLYSITFCRQQGSNIDVNTAII